MKKFIPKKWDYLYNMKFINGYDRIDDLLIVYYDNDESKTEMIPYSYAAEKEILDKMKRQVLTAQSIFSTYKKDYSQDKMFFGMDAALSIVNLGIANLTQHPGVHYTIAGISGLMALFFGASAFRDKEKMDEVQKYIYFLEHQKLINEDIIDHFMQEDDIEGFEPNTLSLNDIESYSLKELQEMVEGIEEQNRQRKLVA